MSETLDWSSGQVEALRLVHEWYKDKKSKQVFRLFGFAGTGKTTIAKEIAKYAKNPYFMAFTGKAALMLEKKGSVPSSTIHSAIYKVDQDPFTGKRSYRINHRDAPIQFADLLIVDEVSFVNEELGTDLLSFGKKILVLGDPFQLPPVTGTGFFVDGSNGDYLLTEIHRQALENPIIRLSMDVRNKNPLRVGRYGDQVTVVDGQQKSMDWIEAAESRADQILVGTHKTRIAVNRRWRNRMGYTTALQDAPPTVGERLVCLKNNRDKHLLNGSLWTVDHASVQNSTDISMDLTSLDFDDRHATVTSHYMCFDNGKLDWRTARLYDEFTYGYGLTVHKAQGSQWNNVMLFNEAHCFGDDYWKHLYTGLTRAAEKAVVVL